MGWHQHLSASKRGLDEDSDDSESSSSSEDGEHTNGDVAGVPNSDPMALDFGSAPSAGSAAVMKDFDREILMSMVNDQIKRLKLNDKSASRLQHFCRVRHVAVHFLVSLYADLPSI